MRIELNEAEIDTILDLVNRKIEKAKDKEIDENQIVFLNNLKDLKGNIESQISQ